MTATPPATLRPLKIEGHLVAKRVDENGETVGEVVLAPLVVYAPAFGHLARTVEESWPRLIAEFDAQQAASRETEETAGV